MFTENTRGFLDETRLLKGPWQAFERDVARLFLQNGFDDVRLVGGTGDNGGDILAVKDGKLWVTQCKYSSASPPPVDAVDEVIRAGSFYSADKLLVAVSRPASFPLKTRIRREKARRLDIELAEPARLLTWMSNSPQYPPTRKKLRTYQQDAADALRDALVDTGRGQIVLATGLGKTVILAEVVATLLREGLIRDGRVLVLAHTLPLVNQLTREFWYQLPRDVACHQLVGEERPSYWDGLTFATIQSVARYLGALPAFGLVIVDEAHHIGAATFQEAVTTLEPPMLAGATATPWRGDEYDIDSLLGPPLVQMGIPEGLAGGHLSEVDYRLLADNIDWKLVQKASINRYSLSQLNRNLIIPTRDDMAARIVAESFASEKRRAAIAYCPSAVHAREFAARLRQYGLRAESILHDVEQRMRARMMSQFRAGHLDVVTTVDLFNEGVDVPDVDMIVFMRVTHSRRIFVQQLGRGLRCSPGKDKVLVLDFVSDLRRIAEVIELDRATRHGDVERLGLGPALVSFSDRSAGSFLKEWMLDQASLLLRDGDPQLEIPRDLLGHEYPDPPPPGGIQ